MTHPTDTFSEAWIVEKVALEESLGPLLPNGAAGGVVARARRAAKGDARPQAPAALRARARVRRAFLPLEVDEAA